MYLEKIIDRSLKHTESLQQELNKIIAELELLKKFMAEPAGLFPKEAFDTAPRYPKRPMRDVRMKWALPLYKVSEDTGIPRAILESFEGGHLALSVEILEQLAEYFSVTVPELLGG